jgi:hypothetical protein
MTVLIFWAIAGASCGTTNAVTPRAMMTAECMVEVLQGLSGYTGARVVTRPDFDTVMLSVSYGVREPSGQTFHRRVDLYEHGWGFSVPMTEGVTRPLFEAWRPCGVTVIDVSSS